MAKLDIDPVLEQLVHAVNESGQARVPITVAAHGTLVSGVLIAQEAYFSELAEGSPLLSAPNRFGPSSSSRTTSSAHRSPTTSRARATPHGSS